MQAKIKRAFGCLLKRGTSIRRASLPTVSPLQQDLIPATKSIISQDKHTEHRNCHHPRTPFFRSRAVYRPFPNWFNCMPRNRRLETHRDCLYPVHYQATPNEKGHIRSWRETFWIAKEDSRASSCRAIVTYCAGSRIHPTSVIGGIRIGLTTSLLHEYLDL